MRISKTQKCIRCLQSYLLQPFKEPFIFFPKLAILYTAWSSNEIDDLEIRPENILLIDDVESTFIENVMYTGEKDGKLFTQEKEQTITNVLSI